MGSEIKKEDLISVDEIVETLKKACKSDAELRYIATELKYGKNIFNINFMLNLIREEAKKMKLKPDESFGVFLALTQMCDKKLKTK